MDKKGLIFNTIFLIPGLGMLYMLLSGAFSKITETGFIYSKTFAIIVICFCLIVVFGSIVLLILKKYKTVDSLQDARDERELNKMVDIVQKYMRNFQPESYNTTSREEIKDRIVEIFKDKNL